MRRMASSFGRYADAPQRASLDGHERRPEQGDDKRAAGAQLHAARRDN
jgi:hypothetical protein